MLFGLCLLVVCVQAQTMKWFNPQQSEIRCIQQREQAVLPLGCEYCDIGSYFLKPDGKIDETLFKDGLHPNAKGYDRIAEKVAE